MSKRSQVEDAVGSEAGVASAHPLSAPRGAGVPLRGLAAARAYVGFLRDPIATIRDLHARHGRLVAIGQSPLWRRREKRYFVALGPDFNRTVLGDPETFRTTGQGLSGPRGSARRRIRNGLTRSRGDKHRRIRQLLVPLFLPRGIDAAWPTVMAATGERVASWQRGDTIDLAEEMRLISLQVASEVLFALDSREQSRAIGVLMRDFMRRSFSLGVLAFPFDWPATPTRALERRALTIEREIGRVIESRRRDGAKGDDAVALLLRALAQQPDWLEPSDLVGQITLLFGASHETTALALTWTLFLLSQHPEVATELADELDAELHGDPMQPEQAGRLPLLDRVIRESLRLFPPVPYTIRTATRDSALADATVARGDKVICSHYFTHHMPELYAEPERFLPQRWESLRPDPAAYLPFSMSPRMCIGQNFATAVIKGVLTTLLPRVRLAPPRGSRIDRAVRVTLGPRAGMAMRVLAPERGFAVEPVAGNVREMVALPG